MSADYSQYPFTMPMPGSECVLDSDHALADGLVSYCVTSKGSGTSVKNLAADDGDLTLQNADQWNWTDFGPQVHSSDAPSYRYSSSNATRYRPGSSNAFTAIIVVEVASLSDFDGLFMKTDVAADWNKGFGLACVSGVVRAWVDDYSVSGNYVTLPKGSPGGYRLWAIRCDGSTLKLTRVDQDGRVDATPVAKVPTTLNLAANQYSDLKVGASHGGGTQTAQTNFILYAQWSRALADDELADFIDNPACMARFPRGEVIRITPTARRLPVQMIIDTEHDPDSNETVWMARGTHEVEYTEWDVLDATMGLRDQNLFGGIRAPEVARRRKAAFVAPFLFSSGAAADTPYYLGGASPCNERLDEDFILELFDWFASLPNAEIALARSRTWGTGWSAGFSVIVDIAMRNPDKFSKIAGRHGAIALTTDPGDTLDQLNYSWNSLAAALYEWDVPPTLPMPNATVPTGCSNTGSSGSSFDWRTDATARQLEIAVLNGSFDPADNETGQKYSDWIAATFAVMQQYGYSSELLWQVIVEGGEENPQACPFPSDPELQANWSDYCHAQSIGWMERALWEGRAAFDEADAGEAAYCTRSDVEKAYGAANVRTWADLSSNGNDDEIDDRVPLAIQNASREIDERLLGGPYSVPFDAMPDTPNTIRRIATILAAYDLYNARGTQDFDEQGDAVHRLSSDRRRALRQIAEIHAGRIRIAADGVYRAPSVVAIDTPVNAAGTGVPIDESASWQE